MYAQRKLRAAALLLALCLCRQGWADIYIHTDPDGALSLSNVPGEAGYTVLIAAPAPPQVRDVPAATPRQTGLGDKARYAALVDEVSRTWGLESALLHAVISVESAYNARAVSPKGAVGLMQLMPVTARRYGVADAFDPLQNLTGGARYLRDLMGRFGERLDLALAAYNAGEHAVERHGNRIPPYRETMQYVPRVLDFYARYRTGL